MDRRQFFKRVAATCVVAVVVPATLMGIKKPLKVKWTRLSTQYRWDELERLRNKNRVKMIIFDEFAKGHPQYWSLINKKWWGRETTN